MNTMNKSFRTTLVISLLLTIGACGYHNPYVIDTYKGPAKVVFLDIWPNQTSEFGLETTLYRDMINWFQKSSKLSITRDIDKADLILKGAIIGIDLPGLSYTASNTVRDVKILLTVRFSLKDRQSGKILWDESAFMLQEPLRIVESVTANSDNQRAALAKLSNELAEKIYINTLNILTDLQKKGSQ